MKTVAKMRGKPNGSKVRGAPAPDPPFKQPLPPEPKPTAPNPAAHGYRVCGPNRDEIHDLVLLDEASDVVWGLIHLRPTGTETQIAISRAYKISELVVFCGDMKLQSSTALEVLRSRAKHHIRKDSTLDENRTGGWAASGGTRQ